MDIRSFKELTFSNDVITLNGVHFLHQEKRGQFQFDYLLGQRKIEKIQIEKFQENIAYGESLSKEQGFSYKHIVFPCKPVVFRDDFCKIGCHLDPIFSHHHLNDFVYYPNLSPSHYDSLETHTNDLGMMHILSKVLADFELDVNLSPSFETRETGGDLGAMLGNGERCLTQKFQGFFSKLNIIKIKRFSLASGLKGNTGHLDFSFNQNAIFNKRILLFGDSFFRTKLDLFSSLFSEVIYFRCPFVLLDVVRNLEPNIVLTGNAERYLVNVPSFKKSLPWFFNYLGENFSFQKIDPNAMAVIRALFSGQDLSAHGLWSKTIPFDTKFLQKVSMSDIKNPSDVDFLRDMAVFFEDKNLELSIKLMKLASEARPTGLIIRNKLKKYEQKMLDLAKK